MAVGAGALERVLGHLSSTRPEKERRQCEVGIKKDTYLLRSQLPGRRVSDGLDWVGLNLEQKRDSSNYEQESMLND